MENVQTAVNDRVSLMQNWLSQYFQHADFSVSPLAGDASFRRYFRAKFNNRLYVVMDAPPEKENCDAFIAIATAFSSSPVRFPTIIAADRQNGFLLLSDFGDRQLLPLLNDNTVDTLYRDAMDALLLMQSHNAISDYTLPHFDEALYWREFDILDSWYIQKHLGKSLSSSVDHQLKTHYANLISALQQQPTVFVHRDYHSRNIMLCDDNQLGILDFQDAVIGTITYDLVSLLKDCYIAWPRHHIENWVRYFFDALAKHNRIHCDFATFMMWFDFAGLQRHLKCLGIFSRLHYRDNKNGYLKEIPRVLNYVTDVCDRYPEFSGLKAILV